MSSSLVLAWRPGVSAERVDEQTLAVISEAGRALVRGLPPAVANAFARLSDLNADEDECADAVLAEDGPAALAEWYYHLGALFQRGMAVRMVQVDGRPVATLMPHAGVRGDVPPLPAEAGYRLSRFAYIRREGTEFVLESPTALGRLVVHDARALAVLGALAVLAKVEDVGPLDRSAVARLFQVLAWARLISEVDADGNTAEDRDPALRCWEFHDLLFHARSRRGRHAARIGATYRFAGQTEPPPALKPGSGGELLPLERPDLDSRAQSDPPFARVVAERRSIREYSRLVSSGELAEFLFRVARVTQTRDAEVGTPIGPLTIEFASRPYPSGGALYELEFYAAVQACEGLPPGLYHYRGERYALQRTRCSAAELGRLVTDAAASAAIAPDTVQIVIILSARFPRLAWKYESIAYALVLKHVGVVYQTMYLTATAMGLAPCALGAGDSDAFARAAGIDYYAETSVGEFLLGGVRMVDFPGAVTANAVLDRRR